MRVCVQPTVSQHYTGERRSLFQPAPSLDGYDGSVEVFDFARDSQRLKQFSQLGSLDFDRQVSDPALSEKPLVGPGEGWDGSKILSALTQFDTQGGKDQDVRCAAASFLAGAIMAGPEALKRVLQRLETAVKNPEDQKTLRNVQYQLDQGTATHGDLSQIQELLFRTYGTPGASGMSGEQQATMRQELTGIKHAPRYSESPEKTAQRLQKLKNGESFTASILQDNGAGHAVQVGRDQEGRLYVYDPAPPEGQPQLLRPEDPLFDAYVNGTFRPESQNLVSDNLHY